MVGQKITEAFRVNDSALLHYHDVMSEKKPATFEIISEVLDNNWIEIRAYPTATGLTSYFKDITSRKMAEKELNSDRLNLVKELAFQNEEKAHRAAELVIANKELVFQSKEKDKRAAS